MGKRFAIVIGVAATGVMMALGAQSAAAAPVKYDTELMITHEGREGKRTHWHGSVMSDRDRNPEYDPAHAVEKCQLGRRVVLWRQRHGADRKLGTDRRVANRFIPAGTWGDMSGLGSMVAPARGRVYAKVGPKVGDGFVCRAGRSRTIVNGDLCFEGPGGYAPTDPICSGEWPFASNREAGRN
jgi:hypothetical protein